MIHINTLHPPPKYAKQLYINKYYLKSINYKIMHI